MRTVLHASLACLLFAVVVLGIIGLAESAIWDTYGGREYVESARGMTELPKYLEGEDADKAAYNAAKTILSHTEAYRKRVEAGLSKHQTEESANPSERVEYWRSRRSDIAERFADLLDFEVKLKLAVDSSKVSQTELKGFGRQLFSLSLFDEFELLHPWLYPVCMVTRVIVLLGLGLLFWVVVIGAAMR